MTTDLLRESVAKERAERDQKLALSVLKEVMGKVRYPESLPNHPHETFLYWLDAEEVTLIVKAMIEFAEQKKQWINQP